MRYVYLITNTVTRKVYVGQTKDFANRKAGHLYAARKGLKRPLYASIRKYGDDNFKFEVIEECDDSIINEREQHWIRQYDSFNPEKGYNLTSGGERDFTVKNITRQQISESLTGRERTAEHSANISAGKRGKSVGRGRTFSAETVQRRVMTSLANRANHKSKKGKTMNKLNQQKANEIRARYVVNGESARDLAAEFGVSTTTIRNIGKGASYTS